MTKQEFETRLGSVVSDETFKIIDFVYLYHPCIDNSFGKDQVAYLFKEFGIRIFKDMWATATEAKALEDDIYSTRQKLSELQTKLNNMHN